MSSSQNKGTTFQSLTAPAYKRGVQAYFPHFQGGYECLPFGRSICYIILGRAHILLTDGRTPLVFGAMLIVKPMARCLEAALLWHLLHAAIRRMRQARLLA